MQGNVSQNLGLGSWKILHGQLQLDEQVGYITMFLMQCSALIRPMH